MNIKICSKHTELNLMKNICGKMFNPFYGLVVELISTFHIWILIVQHQQVLPVAINVQPLRGCPENEKIKRNHCRTAKRFN